MSSFARFFEGQTHKPLRMLCVVSPRFLIPLFVEVATMMMMRLRSPHALVQRALYTRGAPLRVAPSCHDLSCFSSPSKSPFLTNTSTNELLESVQQQQRRHYWFLPTSWTEFKLRMRQVKERRTVYVKLVNERWKQRYHDAKLQYRNAITDSRNYVKGNYSKAKQRYRDSQTRKWIIHQSQKLHDKRIYYKRRRQGLKNRMMHRTRRLQQRAQNMWKNHNKRVTKPVTLTEYSESHWFDSNTGRPLTSRDETGRFVNPWLSQSTSGVHSLASILQWRWERFLRTWKEPGLSMLLPDITFQPSTTTTSLIQRPPLSTPPSADTLRLTWIGHATCLLQYNNMNLLTDPMFSVRASPYKHWIGVARNVPPAYTIHELPLPIDICMISHDHYDHLDKRSVRRLKDQVKLWVVPQGLSDWLQQKGDIDSTCIVELEWWESCHLQRRNDNHWTVVQRHSLRETQQDTTTHPALLQPPSTKDSLWLTCCPAQHWAGRTFLDRNYRLWCTFAVFFDKTTFFFGGDTALPSHFPLFEQIRDYIGRPIDLAALPIGAYEPEFFMRDAHMHPSEALKLHQKLQVKKSLGIHWGSFALSEEPLDEPPRLLQQAIEEENDPSIDFVTIPTGQAIEVQTKKPDEDDEEPAYEWVVD